MRMDVLRIGTEDPDKLDQFMIEHLQTSWDALTERILILHPERCKILTRAFQHIENEDWISAIPLLFSQTDGILMKTFGVSIFYKKNQLEKKIKKKVTNRDMLLNMILDVLMIDTPFDEAHQTSAETSECPNRHAIIHGNENHLEYGTRPNGYKAFSLLCFAVHCCYEVDNA